MHKTYELVSRLPAHEALERIKGLLTKACVKYRAADLSVTSTQTPIVVFGFDPRLYSRTNWVGLNPFTYVSGVEVRCESVDNGLTKVIVRVNRLRAFVWVGFWVACSALAASAMPEPAGTLVVVTFTSAAWLGIVSFLGGYLIKKEIGDHLKGGNHQPLSPG
jgi:hypothetical protein